MLHEETLLQRMTMVDYPDIEESLSWDSMDVEVNDEGTIWILPHYHKPNANPHTQRQMIGATIVGALAGCLACGPLLGIPVGAGTAALAVSSKTPAGDWTRQGGDAVVTAGLEAGERIREWEHEHHALVDKTKMGAVKSYEWASRRLEPRDAPRAGNDSIGFFLM
jgi:hypothetical protein